MDILGFTNLVDESANNPEIQKRIYDALTKVHAQNESTGQDEDDPLLLTFFSDSLYLTVKTDSVSSVFYLLETAAYIMNAFLFFGLFPRGAITRGKCTHTRSGNTADGSFDSTICYGPAVNQAYRDEENKAIWPRIIVDPAVLAVSQFGDATNRPADLMDLFVDMVRHDGNLFYLDHLDGNLFDIDEFPVFLSQLRTYIVKNLREQTNSHIREKYELFSGYFNEILREKVNNESKLVEPIPDALLYPD